MRLSFTTPVATALCLAALCATACERVSSDRYADAFPLFGGLTEERFDASCRAFRARQHADRTLETEAPPEIDWAPDIYAAIERATREDKPIFISTHVNLNGDADRDV
jgi:hypothetical protein